MSAVEVSAVYGPMNRRWRCYIREGRAFRSTGSIGPAVLAQQPLSDADYCRVRALSVGETFIDADGDKWVRTK